MPYMLLRHCNGNVDTDVSGCLGTNAVIWMPVETATFQPPLAGPLQQEGHAAHQSEPSLTAGQQPPKLHLPIGSCADCMQSTATCCA